MRQHIRMLAIDLEHLERDVAPAMASHLGVRGRVGIVLQDQQSFAGPERPGAFLLQPQRLAASLYEGAQVREELCH